jgi:Leucine-rich repeat (LRR) protein
LGSVGAAPVTLEEEKFEPFNQGQKNRLIRLCQEIPFKSANELEGLFSEIQAPELRQALLHCAKENPPQGWSLRDEALQKRETFREKCNLKPWFELVHLEIIRSGSLNCLKYVKMNNLHLVMSPNLVFDFIDASFRFEESVNLLKDMDLKFRMNGICSIMSHNTVESYHLEDLFSGITGPDYQNALLHCISEIPPRDWPLRDVALQKKKEFHDICRVERGVNLDKLKEIGNTGVSRDEKLACLDYMKTNHLYLVINPKLSVHVDNLEDLDVFADLVNGMGLLFQLKLDHWDRDLSLISESLTRVSNLAHVGIVTRLIHLEIQARGQILDFSLLPILPNLEHLTIKNGRLSHLSGFLLKVTQELRFLDLSNNHITEVGKIDLQNLEHLNLNQNQLSDVSEFMKSNLPKLRSLYLDENRIQTIGTIEFMDSFNPQPSALKVLSLSGNELEDVSRLIQSRLSNLVILNLSNNRLKIIGKIEFISNLEELNVSENQLIDVNGLIQSHLPKLRHLRLRSNPLGQDIIIDEALMPSLENRPEIMVLSLISGLKSIENPLPQEGM